MLSQGPHVGVPQAATEHFDATKGRVKVSRRQLDEGGLAGTVGTEHRPALACADLPIYAREHSSVEPVEVDTHETQRRV